MTTIHGGWGQVPANLKCKTSLKAIGLKPSGAAKAKVWNGYNWVELYDVEETMPRRVATSKQLLSLEKARAASIRLRTCACCESIKWSKADLIDSLCEDCRHEQFLEKASLRAQSCFSDWILNKAEHVILDTETTGLSSSAEIVDISVIDLDENVIFDSLVKPVRPIPQEATEIHGITNGDVANAPSWAAVWPQVMRAIEGKHVLIYNKDFDMSAITNNAKVYGLTVPVIESSCIMRAYAEYYGNWNNYFQDFTWIKLAYAADYEDVDFHGAQVHRALGDCMISARLIRKVAIKRQ